MGKIHQKGLMAKPIQREILQGITNRCKNLEKILRDLMSEEKEKTKQKEKKGASFSREGTRLRCPLRLPMGEEHNTLLVNLVTRFLTARKRK